MNHEQPMIIIPEIKTILILVPRCASSSLKFKVLERYPKALSLYRHMEASGIPTGYDQWEKIGVVRKPIERLWSLYNFLKIFNGEYDQKYINKINNSVKCTFNEWLINNETPFTTPYASETYDKFYPYYTVQHSLPDNKKSQFLWLRPDLGTTIFKFNELNKIEKRLDIKLDIKLRNTLKSGVPPLPITTINIINTIFKWDIEQTND